MSALLTLGWWVVAAPAAACHGEPAVLTVVIEGVEVELGEKILLRRLSGSRDIGGTGRDGTAPQRVEAHGTFAEDGGAQVPFHLRLDNPWRLERGGEEITLRPPRAFRAPGAARILGVVGGQVWLAAPGALARLSLAAATLETVRVGNRSAVPLPLEVGPDLLVAAGGELLACSAPGQCKQLAQLSAPATQVVSGPGGWLLATRGPNGALYQVPESQPAMLAPVVVGDVVALCHAGAGDAWAVVAGNGEAQVVAATTALPVARLFASDEVLRRGLLSVGDEEVVAHVLRLATIQAWPDLADLVLRVAASGREALRRLAAEALAPLPGVRATAALWLLGHDEATGVRSEALRASAARCVANPAIECRAALTLFLADADPEVAWSARDRLLLVDPGAALNDAPTGYKLDAIATLVGRLQRRGDLGAERALEMLAADKAPEVRSAARMALAGAFH